MEKSIFVVLGIVVAGALLNKYVVRPMWPIATA